ncbi:MAG TPA: hypothetical protein VJM80_07880 [bacterium]|nr:hypothetical protein [bacterium]
MQKGNLLIGSIWSLRGKLKKQGLITWQGKRIIIQNPQGLEHLANS